MACKIPKYIDSQPFSQTEKERLAGLNIDVFDMAVASNAFVKRDNKLFTRKNNYAAATQAIDKINKHFKVQVARLNKIASTKTSEQFILSVNVLPLTNEKQGGLFNGPKSEFGLLNIPMLAHYFPEISNEPRPVLEKMLKDEGSTEARKGMQKLLDNINKINSKINLEFGGMGSHGADYNPSTGEIRVNAMNLTTAEEVRHYVQHELTHAFSVGVIRNPQTQEEKDFVMNMNRIYSDVLKANLKKDNLPYGFTKVEEFIAELASNPQFRQQLRGTSIWSRIIRAIRKLFGQSDQYDKLLEQYYKVLDDVQNPQRVKGERLNLLTEAAIREAKLPREAKKRIDALEQMLLALNQRKKRYEYQGKGKDRQQAEKDIEALEKLMVNKRNEAVVQSLLIIEREVAELDHIKDALVADPAKINPDTLRNIGIQLTSYEVLNSFANQIRRTPLQFIESEASVPVFLKQLDDLRAKVRLMEEDVKELNRKRFAWVVAQKTTDPTKNYDSILENLEVADRDITWWNRWAESPRGVADEAVVAVHKILEQTYAQAHRDAVTEDIYRKDAKEEKAHYKTYRNKDWFDNVIEYKSVGIIKAEEDYEKWLKGKGKNISNLADKFSPIINQETLSANANGVKFISPLSKEGKDIMRIKEGSEDYPLRQFYETVVLGYLKAQEKIAAPSMRPGLRIPSIQRSLFEGLIREKGVDKFKLLKEDIIKTLRRRSDDTDFRAVDENMNPISYLPTRFTSKQDGKDGRMTTREVSLDISTTVAIFMEEMRTREGMTKVMSDLEIGKEVVGERKVVKSTQRISLPGIGSLLTRERTAKHDPVSGIVERKEGVDSESYRMIDTLMRRFMYGEFKQDAGDLKIGDKKINIRKGVDAFIKYTGLNIMLGNVAIPLTNLAVGELTMFKEALGGNLIDHKNLAAGHALYKDAAMGGIRDLGEREKKSKFGRVFMYFNPMGNERPAENIGIDTSWMRTTLTHLFKSGSNTVEYKLASETIGAVMDRFKVKDPSGKEVSMYDGIEVNMNGKVQLLKGYIYKGGATLSDKDINEVRDYTLRLYQLVNGNYSRLDAPGATETILGDLMAFMRKWLPEGIAARWKTRYYDESLTQEVEGHYISALIAFNNTFTQKGLLPGLLDSLRILSWFDVTDPELLLLPNELKLPQDQKDEIIKLRRAGIRKSLLELYIIGALSLAMFMLGGDDNDESYTIYMLARIRREMMTFASPTTAWDVLRSPTVVMNTIGGFHRILSDVGASAWALGEGEDMPIYKSGPGKGHDKLLFDINRQLGTNFIYQFNDLDTKTRLISGGGWR